ncbi:MAG: YbfB/YjiJ family MFS transporter, partial [Chloroflexi bacterium]|nr:YbfB/YjiJ family MFS transporter [Chloroflexota bacterium]
MSAVGWRGSSVAVVSAAMLAVTAGLGLARFGYALLIPDMRTALGVGYAEMGALASANFVGYVAAALVGGMLGTRFGVRRVLFAGLVIVTAATAGTGLATSIPVAAAYQVFAGIGGAVCAVSGIGLAASYVEPRWRGLATGVATGGNGLGLGLSGLVLPAVLATGPDGWRWGWALLGSLCALCGAYVAFVVRQEARSQHGGVASGGQRHRVFGSPLVWWLCAVYLLWGLGYQIFGTFFASLAIADGGWDQWTAGRLWALTGFASIGSCPLWGLVSDRLGRPPVLALLLTVQGVA